MPWVRVWIHFVWSTKNREPYLNSDIRHEVFAHIRENARAKNIHIDCMSGYVDHAHCLVSLGTNQAIEKIMQLIKGESSFWINQSGVCKTKFGWQDEYFAVSVSEANVPALRKYMANQGRTSSEEKLFRGIRRIYEARRLSEIKDAGIHSPGPIPPTSLSTYTLVRFW